MNQSFAIRRILWPRRHLLLLAAVLLQCSAADQARAGPPVQPVDYMIVVTGGELLVGAYADGHTLFLTQTLRPMGLRCVGAMTVDDKRSDIQEALRFATAKAGLVIITGGLGPTENDVTREAVSEFTGIPLREHPEALRQMLRRLDIAPDALRPNLRRQTRVPERGSYLKNSLGTALGLVFEFPPAVIVALPGPPRELQSMVREELVPYLSQRFGTRRPGSRMTLRFVGLGQSQISQTLDENALLPPNVVVSSQFEGSRVDYTFTLPDDTPEGRARLQKLKQQILKHLGDHVYADDTTSLEEHVAQLLEKRNASLALAEIGSDGALAASFNENEAERGGRVLAGAYIAPTADRLRHLLGTADVAWDAAASDTERLRLLAATAAERTESNWAVAVGEVRRDAKGSRRVDVVFRLPDGRTESRRIKIRGHGELAQTTLTTQILDQMRRKLR